MNFQQLITCIMLFFILLPLKSSTSPRSVVVNPINNIAPSNDIHIMIDSLASVYEQEMIHWRRDFHKHPELSNREYNTAKKIANHLKELGLSVDTGIAKTGVVAVLKTGKAGPTVGLRADIDGLPVKERTDISFKSVDTGEYLGEQVPVMHACGHDTHIAMLLAAAHVLVDLKSHLKGEIVFIFQPAEEGAPPGEEGGAKLMVKEGIIERYGIDVVFGQHISSGIEVGTIMYKTGGIMAASDVLNIKVKGKQTHGSRPWAGIDPMTISAQIIQGLNNIVSRQTALTQEAAVISIGKIEGGVRNNIIPEEVNMTGTIRTLDVGMQKIIHEKIKLTVTKIAEAWGAKAEVEIQIGYPVTHNDQELTSKMVNSLFLAIGEENVRITPASTGAEDFSFFAQEVPGMYYFVGGRPSDVSIFDAAPHHTPDFYIDESGMLTGVKALSYLTVDYLGI